MRFVLDSDVDEGGCRGALERLGQEVVTAHAGGVEDVDRDVFPGHTKPHKDLPDSPAPPMNLRAIDRQARRRGRR